MANQSVIWNLNQIRLRMQDAQHELAKLAGEDHTNEMFKDFYKKLDNIAVAIAEKEDDKWHERDSLRGMWMLSDLYWGEAEGTTHALIECVTEGDDSKYEDLMGKMGMGMPDVGDLMSELNDITGDA